MLNNISNPSQLKADLRVSCRRLNDRGLYYSCKWAAELMVSIDSDLEVYNWLERIHEEKDNITQLEGVEDAVILARSYFDLKEYQRCANILKDCNSHIAFFLRNYSLYVDGERSKNDRINELSSQPARFKIENQNLIGILKELQIKSKEIELDAYENFLYALVLKELSQNKESIEKLIRSINSEPYNWSAWKLLSTLCIEDDILNEVENSLNPGFMKRFFLTEIFVEMHQSHQIQEDTIEHLEILDQMFPNSNFVLAQMAMVKYHLREFDQAQQLFEELKEVDPYRLEEMDTYSNILYVKEDKNNLGLLAHTCFGIDKYRAESCCIIGNYYSLKGNHENAIIYFKRALKLNPKYLSAWTLMGHEFVELRNSPSAIEAYRNAVDINPSDYRAWYGLGQTYEILKMHSYSLYYFRKAIMLRPYDPRMWLAMAECFDHLNQPQQAIRCYLRAEVNEEREGNAFLKLAKLFQQLGDHDKSAQYYKQVINRLGTQNESPEIADALMFLAEYYKDRHKWTEAEGYCHQIMNFGGNLKEQAKSLMLEIRQLANKEI